MRMMEAYKTTMKKTLIFGWTCNHILYLKYAVVGLERKTDYTEQSNY